MKMDELPGTSKLANSKAINNPAAIRKKKKVKKFAASLFNEDVPSANLVNDIIEPNLKNMFLDILSSIADTIIEAFEVQLFKDGARSKRMNRKRGGDPNSRMKNGYIDYSSSSSKRRGGSEDIRRRWNQDVADFSDLSYKTYNDAKDALVLMKEAISKYDGPASVADLYRFSRLSPRSALDSQWGWDDLSSAYPIRDSDDPDYPYTLVLPEPRYIGKR